MQKKGNSSSGNYVYPETAGLGDLGGGRGVNIAATDGDFAWLLKSQKYGGDKGEVEDRLDLVDDLSIYNDEVSINQRSPTSFHDNFYKQHKGSYIASVTNCNNNNNNNKTTTIISKSLEGNDQNAQSKKKQHDLIMTAHLKPSPYLGHKRGPKKTLMEQANWGCADGAKKAVKLKPFLTDPAVLSDESFMPLFGIEKATSKRERRITNDIIFEKNVAFEVSKFEGKVFDDFELDKLRIEKEKKKLKDFVLIGGVSGGKDPKINNIITNNTSNSVLMDRSIEINVDNGGSYFTNYEVNSAIMTEAAAIANTGPKGAFSSMLTKYAAAAPMSSTSNNTLTNAMMLPELFSIDKFSDQSDMAGLKPLYRLVIEESLIDKKHEKDIEKASKVNLEELERKKKKSLSERQLELKTLKMLHFDDIPLAEGIDFKSISKFKSFSLESFIVSKVIYYLVFVFVTRIYPNAKIFVPRENYRNNHNKNDKNNYNNKLSANNVGSVASSGSKVKGGGSGVKVDGSASFDTHPNGLYACIQRHVQEYGLDYTNINSLYTIQLFKDIIKYDSELYDTLIIIEIAHLTVKREEDDKEEVEEKRKKKDGKGGTNSSYNDDIANLVADLAQSPTSAIPLHSPADKNSNIKSISSSVFFVYSFFFPEQYLLYLSKIMSFETINVSKLRKMSPDFHKLYQLSRKIVKHVYMFALRNAGSDDHVSNRDKAFYEYLHQCVENNQEFECPNRNPNSNLNEGCYDYAKVESPHSYPGQIFVHNAKTKRVVEGLSGAFNGLYDLFDMKVSELSSSRAEQLLKHNMLKRVKPPSINHRFSCVMPTECLDIDAFNLYKLAIDNVQYLIKPFHEFKVVVVNNSDDDVDGSDDEQHIRSSNSRKLSSRNLSASVALFDELMFTPFDSPLHEVINFDAAGKTRVHVVDLGDDKLHKKPPVVDFKSLKKAALLNSVSIHNENSSTDNIIATANTNTTASSITVDESSSLLPQQPTAEDVYRHLSTDVIVLPAPVTIYFGNNSNKDDNNNNGAVNQESSFWTSAINVNKAFMKVAATLGPGMDGIDLSTVASTVLPRPIPHNKSVKTVILAPTVLRRPNIMHSSSGDDEEEEVEEIAGESPFFANKFVSAPATLLEGADYKFNFTRISRISSIQARGPSRYLVCITDTENSDSAASLAKKLSRACDHVELLHIPLPSERDIMIEINNLNSAKEGRGGKGGGYFSQERDGGERGAAAAISMTSAGGNSIAPSSMICLVSNIIEKINKRIASIGSGGRTLGMNMCFGEEHGDDIVVEGSNPTTPLFDGGGNLPPSSQFPQLFTLENVSSAGLLNQVVVGKIIDSYIKLKRMDGSSTHPGDYISTLLVSRVCRFLLNSPNRYDFILFGAGQSEVEAISFASLTSFLESKMFAWSTFCPSPNPSPDSNSRSATPSEIEGGNSRLSAILLHGIGQMELASPPSVIFTC